MTVNSLLANRKKQTQDFCSMQEIVADQGFSRVMIRAIDTDAVVLTIAVYRRIEVEEFWISFGTEKKIQYIPAHGTVQALGSVMARVFPAFHALTGCDQTFLFASTGKKTAWETWKTFHEVRDVLEAPSNVLNEAMPVLEHFVVLLFDRNSTSTRADEPKNELFTRKASWVVQS